MFHPACVSSGPSAGRLRPAPIPITKFASPKPSLRAPTGYLVPIVPSSLPARRRARRQAKVAVGTLIRGGVHATRPRPRVPVPRGPPPGRRRDSHPWRLAFWPIFPGVFARSCISSDTQTPIRCTRGPSVTIWVTLGPRLQHSPNSRLSRRQSTRWLTAREVAANRTGASRWPRGCRCACR